MPSANATKPKLSLKAFRRPAQDACPPTSPDRPSAGPTSIELAAAALLPDRAQPDPCAGVIEFPPQMITALQARGFVSHRNPSFDTVVRGALHMLALAWACGIAADPDHRPHAGTMKSRLLQAQQRRKP
jgi:hypothetical protein